MRSDACELVNNMINHLPSHNPDLERRVPRLTALLDRVDKLEAHLTANEVRGVGSRTAGAGTRARFAMLVLSRPPSHG